MNEVLHLWGTGSLVAVCAAGITYGLIVLLQPFFRRYASARPNIRSSHKIPTPQGGGAAVIAAIIVVVAGAIAVLPESNIDALRTTTLLSVSAVLAVVGAVDDIRSLEVTPRLLFQSLAVVAVIAMLPETTRVLPVLPLWIERALLFVAGLWFVNLTNFMDGVDWMTVAETVPLTAGLVIFGLMGELPRDAMLIASALCGATIGFAPFNRPVAHLFLGDVGSLPIGLLLGWLLILLAGSGHIAAAILLPLYYFADATITLLRRLINGEQIAQAHRSHFYQRALDGGFSVYQIVGRVFGTNIILVGLALMTLIDTSLTIQMILLAIGTALVGALLWHFNRAHRKWSAIERG
jgi:UDP-N-acetylmuramyl pentapeptide phosphotransferase/UDP-N-acetylglucosamine-1-phosphate transferase